MGRGRRARPALKEAWTFRYPERLLAKSCRAATLSQTPKPETLNLTNLESPLHDAPFRSSMPWRLSVSQVRKRGVAIEVCPISILTSRGHGFPVVSRFGTRAAIMSLNVSFRRVIG